MIEEVGVVSSRGEVMTEPIKSNPVADYANWLFMILGIPLLIILSFWLTGYIGL
jgi:hypothetical protein